jgi:hypothetical protein
MVGGSDPPVDEEETKNGSRWAIGRKIGPSLPLSAVHRPVSKKRSVLVVAP